MKPQFDLGIIGGGVAVEMALPALRTFESVAISYNDSPYHKTLSKFEYFENSDELFRNGKVASLYVAVPVKLHKEFLLKAIIADIPTLIEKPLCLDLAQCSEIASLRPSKLSVAFRKRFSPMAQHIRRIRTASSNSVCEIEYVWLAPHPGIDHWKLKREIAGGGVIMDIGSHILDLFEYCVGPICQVELHDVTFDKTFQTESFVIFSCAFEDGSRGRVLIGWAEKESIQKLNFRENHESVTWIKHGSHPSSHLTVIDGAFAQTINCERSEDYFPMFRQFRLFATGAQNSSPSFEAGVRNMLLMNELYKSVSRNI